VLYYIAKSTEEEAVEETVFNEETGEVVERDLVLPIRKDSYGKAYVTLFSKFPEDFVRVEYGAPIVNLGAFSLKFIGCNYPVEDLAEDLADLVGKDVRIDVRFKSLKVRRGLREVNLADVVPEGRSGKTVESPVLLPLNSAGFGDLTGKLEGGVLYLPEGKIVFDFDLPVRDGEVVLSYGISKLTVREVDSKEVINLLAVF